jgi:hypothetical protein
MHRLQWRCRKTVRSSKVGFLGCHTIGRITGEIPALIRRRRSGLRRFNGTSKTIEKQEKIKGKPTRWRSQAKSKNLVKSIGLPVFYWKSHIVLQG